MPTDHLRDAIRDVVDFPKEGIVFKDITPILADGGLFRESITRLCETTAGVKVDKIVGIDARGFIFAAAVADRLGLVQVRDTGALEGWVAEVIAAHPGEVARYKGGDAKLIGFFVGQVMKRSQGKADPKAIQPILTARLAE